MPIPEFNQYGWLPPGLYDCALTEIKKRFGSFSNTDHRVHLFEKLREFAKEATSAGFVKSIIVDGSFVSNKPIPGDIDLIVMLRRDHDFSQELRPFEYNVVSKRMVKQGFKFDILVAEEDSISYQNHLEFFSRVKG